MITRHEGKKECVYLDTKGIKTIGIGYNMQKKEAPEVFASIGADYNKFINGPVTKWNVPCNCSSVPCLTEGQIEELLDISLKTAIADAKKVIPTFASLCCPVQNVMVTCHSLLADRYLLSSQHFQSLSCVNTGRRPVMTLQFRCGVSKLLLGVWKTPTSLEVDAAAPSHIHSLVTLERQPVVLATPKRLAAKVP